MTDLAQITPAGYALFAFLIVFLLAIANYFRTGEHPIKWMVWDFTGLHAIWNRVLPPNTPEAERKKAPTFMLWIIGIYVAFFGLASQRYENRVDIIENRANAIFAQLGTEAKKSVLSRIARVQNMACPAKPEILNPRSVYLSLFGQDDKYHQMIQDLRETVADWREHLKEIDLENADLQGALLFGADFEGAVLRNANLSEANLMLARLWLADLQGANLRGANLEGADLTGAHLSGANLEGAFLRKANIEKAFLTIEQLSKTKTLYKATLDPELKAELKEKYPERYSKLMKKTGSKFDLRGPF